MFKDIQATCPVCGRETTLAISVPDPAMKAQTRGTVTSCRKCPARLLTTTEPDGTVHLARIDHEGDEFHAVPVAAPLAASLGFAEVLRVPFALWQPRGAEIAAFEHRPEWADALQAALAEAQRKPRPLSVPRRIFISYRWGSAEADAWVEQLARELEARGNAIVFDRKATREAHPPSVPELVARIAGCHIFLAVLDPGYVGRVRQGEATPREEGWVTDEYQTALAFADQGVVTGAPSGRGPAADKRHGRSDRSWPSDGGSPVPATPGRRSARFAGHSSPGHDAG